MVSDPLADWQTVSDVWDWINKLPPGVQVVFGAIAAVLTALFGTSRLGAKYANSEADRLEAVEEVSLRDRIAKMDTLVKDLSVRVAVMEAERAGLAAAFSSMFLCQECRSHNQALLDMIQQIFDRHRKDVE